MRILDSRKSVILQAIINDYIQSAEPVGSSGLVERYPLGVRAATVRNEMAEMSDLGYLLQPHTSAGRIPSCMGYRYYVDRLMPTQPSSEYPELNDITTMRLHDPNIGEIDWLLAATCKLLADSTHTACVATAPHGSSGSIKEVILTKPSADKLVLVVIADSGMVEHRLITLETSMTHPQLSTLNQLVSYHWAGKTIDEIMTGTVALTNELHQLESVWQMVVSAMDNCVQAFCRQRMFWDGLQYLLEQPEFQSSDRLSPVMELFSDTGAMAKLLHQLTLPPKAHTVIGDENPLERLRHFSFVVTTYTAGDERLGQLCVLGPTRMNYPIAIAAVEAIAQALSQLMVKMTITD